MQPADRRRQNGCTFASVSLGTAAGRSRNRTAGLNITFELGEATEPRLPQLTPGYLLLHRPVALLALVPRAAVIFVAGAASGAIAKTITAPLDRAKILLQVKGGKEVGAVAAAAAKGNLVQSLIAIGKQEGLMGYWKGNLPQVLRVVPYSAAQLYSYEVFKKAFQNKDGKLSVQRRLAAGACAGMAATLLTYPLDMLRFRIAVDPSCRTISGAVATLLKEGRGAAFYRGLGASLLGIAPYMGLELATFDLLPQDKLPSFARGFTAALVATAACYPLDTVRRRIQLSAGQSVAWQAAALTILQDEGVKGFYRGFVPNTLKNLPNKGVKLSTFDAAKKLLVAGEKAYQEEIAKLGMIWA
ncbi:hypothetical protein N2152v2_011232 [Parachlorella kessleri]